jgi:purine-binding chemotaxis protein CheW
MAEPGSARLEPSAIRRYLTFRLAQRLYALSAEDIAEVIAVPAAARVPHSPPALLGIANLRGAVLPLVGLRQLLGRPPDSGSAIAVVLDGAAPVALVVDAVDSLVAVEQSRIETREAELGAESGELLSGAFQTGAAGEVAKILDVRSLLGAAFAQRSVRQRQLRSVSDAAQASDARQAPDAQMLVTFEVAGQEYALSIEAVQEILPAPDSVTRVARTEAVVLGVISLREKLLPLLSLRGLLGFAPGQAAGTREKVVVMKVGRGQVGLVADQARAVLAAPAASIDPIPEVLAARTGGEARIKGIYRAEAGRRLVSILSPEQLFREDVMQKLGTAAAAEGTPRVEAAQDELKFLVFRLGPDEFALPIEAVDEVGQVPAQVTRLPKTPKFLEGVINLRGDVLPVVDQRRRFDMPDRDAAQRPRLVVVRSERHRAGIIVDSVSDVLRVAGNALEPAPDLTDEIARLVRGVINLEKAGRMVLVLDPVELLTPAERRLLDTFQKTVQAGA